MSIAKYIFRPLSIVYKRILQGARMFWNALDDDMQQHFGSMCSSSGSDAPVI